MHDLPGEDRVVLVEEIARASAALKEATNATKVNVGALGNLVPQLHIHVVARTPDDAAWPGPVWGKGAPLAFAPAALEDLLARLSASWHEHCVECL